MDIDFGKTASDYSRYRPGFPAEFFARLEQRGLLRAGLDALDVGTGTGVIARALAKRGCVVTGLDPAPELLEAAEKLAAQAGLSVRYLAAKAEDTGLPAAAFDLACAGQCWHWLDGGEAARELWRVLRPGGALIVAWFDWLPLPDSLAEATEELILAHNPAWHLGGSNGLHPQPLLDAHVAGFEAIETFSFDVVQEYSPEGWRGRIRSSSGIAAALAPEAVDRFDTDLRALLERAFPGSTLHVQHRVFAMTARKTLASPTRSP